MSKVKKSLEAMNGSVEADEWSMSLTDDARSNSGTNAFLSNSGNSGSRTSNGSHPLTNSTQELGCSVSYNAKSKKMTVDTSATASPGESSTTSTTVQQTSSAAAATEQPPSREPTPLSQCKHNSSDNMSKLVESTGSPPRVSPSKEPPPTDQQVSSDPTPFVDPDSRESSPEGQNLSSAACSSSGAESRSSEPEFPGKKPMGIPRPVSMDFEKMKVSLILRDDAYDDDDLSISSIRPCASENSNQSPRNTPPNTLSNVSENGTEPPPEWTRSAETPRDLQRSSETPRDFQFSSVGFREGRRTPTNGQWSDSSGGRLSLESTSPTGNHRLGNKSSADKKKKPNWYTVLSPTYKSRSEEFKRLFKDIPGDERLIVDYSCALQKDILVHGRIYITQNWICFYANIFRWETVVMMRCKEILSMTKEKTARVIPNAIQICTKEDKYFFTSFGTRDKTYLMLFRVWQNALTDNPMSSHELWQWVRYSYGEELGLNSSDEDYVQPSTEDELHFNARILQDEKIEAAGLEDIKDLEDEESLAEPILLDEVVNGNRSNEAGELPRLSPNLASGKPIIDISPSNVPTDESDTSETDDSEVLCQDHDHLDIAVIEDVYNFNVDKLFEMVFTDSDLYRQFTEVKKTTELVQSQWSEDVDSEGDRHRSISYTLSLNYSIGPKTSPAKEKQVLRGSSKPGAFYLVDTECVNGSIPYGDNFYVVNRYCMARVASNKCRFKITSAIRYKKSVWGVVKNFIEKNVQNGINDSFNCIADLLRQESNRVAQQTLLAPLAGKKKVLRRRRNVSDRSTSIKRPVSDIQPPGHPTQSSPAKTHPSKSMKSTTRTYGGSTASKDDITVKVTADTFVKVICAILVTLVVFNVLLYYKLWSLEQKATLLSYGTQDLWNNPQNQPETPEEWISLLRQQQALHDTEIDRWKDVLSSSIQLMKTMQESLSNMEQGIHAKYSGKVGHDEH